MSLMLSCMHSLHFHLLSPKKTCSVIPCLGHSLITVGRFIRTFDFFLLPWWESNSRLLINSQLLDLPATWHYLSFSPLQIYGWYLKLPNFCFLFFIPTKKAAECFLWLFNSLGNYKRYEVSVLDWIYPSLEFLIIFNFRFILLFLWALT